MRMQTRTTGVAVLWLLFCIERRRSRDMKQSEGQMFTKRIC